MTSKMTRRGFLKTLISTGITLAATATSIYFLIEASKKRAPELPSPSQSPSRLPPGQREVEELIVLHIDGIPTFDEKTWDFQVYGLVNNPFTLNYEQFKILPKVGSISDFHCVTGWSKLDNNWEGVRFRTIMETAEVLETAKFATIECDGGYTTSLPIEDLARDDVFLAYGLDGKDLPLKNGGPLRIVVPFKYGYKSAKWVRRIKFTQTQELGYWEVRGYSNTADPYLNDR